MTENQRASRYYGFTQWLPQQVHRTAVLMQAYRFWWQWICASRRLPFILIGAFILSVWVLPSRIELLSYELFPVVVEKHLMGLIRQVSENPRREMFVVCCWLLFWALTLLAVVLEFRRSAGHAKLTALAKARELAETVALLEANNAASAEQLRHKARTYLYSPELQASVLTAGATATLAKTQVVEAPARQPENTAPAAERYQRVKELGRGAMGTVYLAFDNRLQRHVALKTISALMSDPELVKQRFSKEARMVAKLNHSGIVQIYDFFEQQGRGFIAMEYVEGKPLSALIAQGQLTPSEKRDIARQVAATMAYAHSEGVIHRDLKPANILVNTKQQVKITDFGLAKLSGTNETQVGTIMGSPLYMSPEQAEGQPVDGRSDIYAFGVLLYELLTGQPVFNGETATQLIAQHLCKPVVFDKPSDDVLSPDDKLLINALLEKKPEQRIQSFAEVVQRLAAETTEPSLT